jgi:hypothetical protein
MSEMAAAYYEQRAGDTGVAELPPLLRDGKAVSLVRFPGRILSSGVLHERFCEEVAPVAPVALEGVPLALHGRGNGPTTSQWQVMKERLRPWGRYASLEQFADRNAVRALMKVFPLRGAIFLEALAGPEVPQDAFRRSTLNTGSYRPHPQDPSQEPAQVYLLSRAVTEQGQCVNAHLTVAWGEFTRPAHSTSQYLGVRYLGTPLVAQEIAALPPLLLPGASS